MPRGGRRSPTPGKSYPNRRDLQERRVPIQAATGQQYGKATAQLEAQRALPIAQPGSNPQPQGQAPDLAGMAQAWQPLPGDPKVTQRPNEPVTAGLDVGAGPGSEVLPAFAQPDSSLGALRALYAAYPNEDLRRLIEIAES